jgi:hypothetical protein
MRSSRLEVTLKNFSESRWYARLPRKLAWYCSQCFHKSDSAGSSVCGKWIHWMRKWTKCQCSLLPVLQASHFIHLRGGFNRSCKLAHRFAKQQSAMKHADAPLLQRKNSLRFMNTWRLNVAWPATFVLLKNYFGPVMIAFSIKTLNQKYMSWLQVLGIPFFLISRMRVEEGRNDSLDLGESNACA